jgi:SAM-dependent methyltransferase
MKFNQIWYNSFSSPTDLCFIGEKYGTDKSPLVFFMGHHAYTPFYNFLFSNIRHKNIIFGEIGIYKNASMKMWREYFSNATLYGWDCKVGESLEDRYQEDFIQNAKTENLHNVFYDYMNVESEESINSAFEKSNIKFDVIIDDSSHKFWDQIRLIRNAYKYLNPGGCLIIEDIDYKIYSYGNEIKLYGHDKYYSNITQVKTCNSNQEYGFDCDQILVLIRNEVKV